MSSHPVTSPSRGRQIAANLGATFHNNRAESGPFLGWVAAGVTTQVLHVIVDDPGVTSLVFLVPTLVSLFVLYLAVERKAQGATIYGAGTSTVVFGWLTWATAAGPSTELLVSWVVILACLYLKLLQVILTVKHTPAAQIVWPHPAPAEVPAVDEFEDWLKGARWVGSERPTDTGSVRRLALPPGKSSRDFADKRAEAMASHLQINPAAVELRDPGLGNVVDVYRHDRKDMHAEPRAWPWADRVTTDTRMPCPLGVTRSGGLAHLPLGSGHILIGGTTGAGKSVTVGMIAAAIALDLDADLYAIDPKLADLRPFEHACRSYVQNDYDQARSVLEHVAGEIPRRMALTGPHNVQSVQDIPANPDGSRAVPSLFLIVDELAHLTVDAPRENGVRDDLIRLLGVILKQGRAADVWLIAATQRPSKETIPTDLRAQFRYALALRVRERNTTPMILGDGTGVDASTIPSNRPGVGYLQDDDGVQLMRSFFLPADEVYRLGRLAPPAVGRVSSAAPRLATVHELPGFSAVERMADGSPIPTSGWQASLWELLDEDPRSATELLYDIPNAPARNTLLKQIEAWEKARVLIGVREGNTRRWKKAA
jgi:hypothetical protein